jgi:hypothetical protein
MPIDVHLQDEDGMVLASYNGPFIGLWLSAEAPRGSKCLQFIDPWGDTVFNQMQLGELLSELESAIRASSNAEHRDAMTALAAFVEGAVGRTHTYVKFIGD